MDNTNVCKVWWHVRGARAGPGWAGPPPGPGPCSYVLTHARVQGPPGRRAQYCNFVQISLCFSPFPPAMKIPPKTKYCRHSSLGALHCVLCGHRAAEEQDISMSQVSSFQCSSWLHTVPYPNFMVLIFKLHTYAKTLKISTTDMVRTAAVQQDCTAQRIPW